MSGRPEFDGVLDYFKRRKPLTKPLEAASTVIELSKSIQQTADCMLDGWLTG